MPRRCDKSSADPKDHLGPFKLYHVEDWPEETIRLAHCEACKNTVFRKVKKKPKPAQ